MMIPSISAADAAWMNNITNALVPAQSGTQPQRLLGLELPSLAKEMFIQVPTDARRAESALSLADINGEGVPHPFVDISRASSITVSLRQELTQKDLSVLPAEARDLMFKEFQEASTSRNIERLNAVVNGWLETANIYTGNKLNTALGSSEGFRVIHTRLLGLLQEDEDEDEQTSPSSYALNTTLALLLGALPQMKDLPRANVTADETGGVRVQWISPERQVRLVVPVEKGGRQYLYFETEKDYDLEDNPNSTRLAERLMWFADSA